MYLEKLVAVKCFGGSKFSFELHVKNKFKIEKNKYKQVTPVHNFHKKISLIR